LHLRGGGVVGDGSGGFVSVTAVEREGERAPGSADDQLLHGVGAVRARFVRIGRERRACEVRRSHHDPGKELVAKRLLEGDGVDAARIARHSQIARAHAGQGYQGGLNRRGRGVVRQRCRGLAAERQRKRPAAHRRVDLQGLDLVGEVTAVADHRRHVG